MHVEILSLRYHTAAATRRWLEALPGTGTAYLTDAVHAPQPEGGRRSVFPGGRKGWLELKRPGDLEAAAQAAAQGADILYKYPGTKRRRIFVRHPDLPGVLPPKATWPPPKKPGRKVPANF